MAQKFRTGTLGDKYVFAQMRFYFNGGHGNNYGFKAALFADSNGKPGNKIVDLNLDQSTFRTREGWFRFTPATETILERSTVYHIALGTNDGMYYKAEIAPTGDVRYTVLGNTTQEANTDSWTIFVDGLSQRTSLTSGTWSSLHIPNCWVWPAHQMGATPLRLDIHAARVLPQVTSVAPVLNADRTSVTLTWNAYEQTGGRAFQRYEVFVDPTTDAAPIKYTVTGKSTSGFSIAGLESGKSYDVWVQVVNEDGTGGPDQKHRVSIPAAGGL